MTEEPSEKDVERYYYYIMKGIKQEMLAPQDAGVMEKIQRLITPPLLATQPLLQRADEIHQEIVQDYELSLRKAIGMLGALKRSWVQIVACVIYLFPCTVMLLHLPIATCKSPYVRVYNNMYVFYISLQWIIF